MMSSELSSSPDGGTGFQQFVNRFGSSFKFGYIFFLTLLMLIPIGMIDGVINERKNLSGQVKQELSSSWGGAQQVLGPVVAVPYTLWVQTTQNGKEKKEKQTRYAFFLPETLKTKATLNPDTRQRGIYKTVVYETTLTITGTLPAITLTSLKAIEPGLQEGDVLWDKTLLLLNITDIKGIQPNASLKLGGQALPLEPGGRFKGIQATVKATLLNQAASRFELTLPLHGSEAFYGLPLGKETTLELNSKWPSPSFTGSYLPNTRTVNEKGFNAEWQLSHFSRSFPQAFSEGSLSIPEANLPLEYGNNGMQYATAASVEGGNTFERIFGTRFGVALIDPVDFYHQVERSVKYGILFLSLTFVAFFLFEILAGLSIHIFQYTLVGFGLALFYVLLLAFAEVLGFLPAYLLASMATIALLSYYTLGFITSKKQAWIMPCLLTLLYTYLYVLLQLEDYSLLVVCIGLFVALAVVMSVTRNVNWFKKSDPS